MFFEANTIAPLICSFCPGGELCRFWLQRGGRATGGLQQVFQDGLRQRVESHRHTAGDDRGQQACGVLSAQHDQRIGRRLLQRFEKGIGGLRIHLFGFSDDDHAPPGQQGIQAELIGDLSHLVDLDELPIGRHRHDVWMASLAGSLGKAYS